MKKLILFISIIIHIQAFGQRYAFDSIPEFLKVKADAVVRTEQMVYTILKPSKAIKKYKIAITLLNENVSDYRYTSIFYDKFNRVKSIKASVYDQKGKLIKILKQSEILDMSAISGTTFYSDDRRKLIAFPLMKFPYTIEYEYEMSINSILTYPTWSFQDSPDISVEKSGVQFIVPKTMSIRFKESYLKYKVDSISIKDKVVFTWLEENIPTIKTNSYGIPFSKRNPRLLVAPITFEYNGYKGSMESWNSLGAWNRDVISGRDILPESEVTKIKELVKDITDERQKVKAVYEYMQSKTRYVSIQLGIGGFQPFEASFVAEKGYGDCKALTNYTMALLKTIGINSYYTLVKSGYDNDIDPTFIDDQFDHIILSVPLVKDTVWLECTSQTLPFNYLSGFTSDRYVLLTTPDGGKLVHTPGFNKIDNTIKQKGQVNIDQLGSITTANLTTNYSGIFYGISQGLYGQQSDEEIKQLLDKSIRISTFEVKKVSFNEVKSENPTSSLFYELTIRDFCIKSPNRIYFTPCLNKEDYLMNDPFSIQIKTSSNNIDSITYNLPIGYSIEYLPNDKKIETPFGSYSYSLSIKDNKIEFVRSFDVNYGKYSIDMFNEFHAFLNSIAQTDRNMIILKKNEN